MNISQVFHCVGHENHVISESISSRLTTLTTYHLDHLDHLTHLDHPDQSNHADNPE